MKPFFCGMFVAFLLLPFFAHSQKGFSIGPTPGWVKAQEVATQIPDTADISGFYNLLNDVQENIESHQSYVHSAVKVVNDKGLSYASSWDWSFDPSFERMTFNSLYILRGKQKIDHLSVKNFEIIQREENLSRAMYDGSLSVIVNLKDVKAGDVVVFSYTTTGINPVFKDHFFRTFRFNFNVPYGKISCRVIADKNRALYFKDFGTPPERKENALGPMKELSWEAVNVAALEEEDRQPSWHSLANRVQISDFKDWTDFSKWTVDLFKTKHVKSKHLIAFIDSLKSIKDTETRILTAIKTVQEKIRYFSFTDGMSAYRPHDPSDVFSNKYGDCKDKALLLSEILNEIGVESHPLLVSTAIGKVMDERLPAPWNFDHSIAQVKYNDSIYYIDATISSQRGSLKKIVTPDYYFGVLADEDQPGLTSIPTTKDWSSIRAREDFEVLDIGGSARLSVETYYSGSEADNVRDGFKGKTKAETNKDYVNFYANEFPDIKLTKSISFKDDTVNNAITVFEEYEIPTFWSYDSAKGLYVADTYGRVVSGYLATPSTRARKTPFVIRYPLDVQLISNIHLPEEWEVDNYSKKINGPGFNFSSKSSYADRVIRLEFNLHNTLPIVEASKTKEFVDKVDDIYNQLSFQITYKKNSESTSTSSADGRVTLLIICAGALIFAGAKKLFYFNPRSRQLNERHDRIAGWLLLPAIGLSIWPFTVIFVITSEWASHRGIFADSPFNIHKAVLIGNLLTKLALLGLVSLCAVLFWNRRTSTPYFIVAAYALNLLIVTADITLGISLYDIDPGMETKRNAMVAVGSAAIWIPYFLMSERSRGTFTRRLVNWRDQQD